MLSADKIPCGPFSSTRSQFISPMLLSNKVWSYNTFIRYIIYHISTWYLHLHWKTEVLCGTRVTTVINLSTLTAVAQFSFGRRLLLTTLNAGFEKESWTKLAEIGRIFSQILRKLTGYWKYWQDIENIDRILGIHLKFLKILVDTKSKWRRQGLACFEGNLGKLDFMQRC